VAKHKSLIIHGVRWHQKAYGNTYSAVSIEIDGKQVYRSPFEYGYGDYFLQMAMEWMQANGFKIPSYEAFTAWAREHFQTFDYTVADVKTKRELQNFVAAPQKVKRKGVAKNPVKKKSAKKPSPAQLAAREKFAAMVRAKAAKTGANTRRANENARKLGTLKNPPKTKATPKHPAQRGAPSPRYVPIGHGKIFHGHAQKELAAKFFFNLADKSVSVVTTEGHHGTGLEAHNAAEAVEKILGRVRHGHDFYRSFLPAKKFQHDKPKTVPHIVKGKSKNVVKGPVYVIKFIFDNDRAPKYYAGQDTSRLHLADNLSDAKYFGSDPEAFEFLANGISDKFGNALKKSGCLKAKTERIN